MNPQNILFRRAIIWSLVLSVPALIGVCIFVAGLRNGTHLAVAYPLQTGVAFGCMLAFGWYVAPRWGVCCTRYPFLAGLFAVLVFLIGVLFGSATSMLVYREFSPFDYIIKPLYWMGLLGFIPAFLLGIIGAYISRRLIRTRAT